MQIEDKKIKIIKNLSKFQLVKNICIFLKLSNFYCYFIHSFNKIIVPFILMLKISNLFKVLASIIINYNNNEIINNNKNLEFILFKLNKTKFITFKNLAWSKFL